MSLLMYNTSIVMLDAPKNANPRKEDTDEF